MDFAKAPNSFGLGFGLTASTPDDYHAVYFYSDDALVGSNLFRNGEHFSFPSLTKEGNVFIGWYNQLPNGTLFRETDEVCLSGDMNLYAFWWAWDSEECHYDTPGGSKVDISTKVDGSSVLVDVDAKSSDGRVVVSMHGVNVSQMHIKVPAKVHLEGPDDIFTVADAHNCVEVLSTISNWFSDRGLDPRAQAETDTGNAKAEVNALKVLYDGGFGFEILPTDGGRMSFDKDALNGVYRQCASIHLGLEESAIDFSSVSGLDEAVCTFILRIASDSDMNDAQRKTVGNSTAWYSAIIIDGKAITELHTGKMTLSIPFTGVKSGDKIHVYSVKDDGVLEVHEFAYDGSEVTFDTQRLSVFMITSESHRSLLPLVGIGAVLLVLMIPLILGVKRRSG